MCGTGHVLHIQYHHRAYIKPTTVVFALRYYASEQNALAAAHALASALLMKCIIPLVGAGRAYTARQPAPAASSAARCFLRHGIPSLFTVISVCAICMHYLLMQSTHTPSSSPPNAAVWLLVFVCLFVWLYVSECGVYRYIYINSYVNMQACDVNSILLHVRVIVWKCG